MKTIKSSILSVAVAAGLTAMASTAFANDMVNPEAGVVVGYWHNWCDGSGYKGGIAPCVKLDQVNPMYNVVDVSFMKVYDTAEGRIPTFRLDPAVGMTENEFIDQINELNNQGRSVLLALGGADAHIELKAGDEHAFAEELIRLVDLYGFDGLDIDLEQAAVTAADNQTVIPAALIMVKKHYQAQGKNFLVTMAPEFPYLTQGGKYVPYLDALEGYYDWINPQFYNQGGDGLWIDGVGWLAQNNDQLKQEFIYYIADSLINGSRGYHKIPHDKLVFGIPTNIDAAATGYVKEPQKLYSAFEALKNQGQPLKGVMTWSVNWDMGRNASGSAYNESFINAYGPFIHSQTPPLPETGKPVFKGLTDLRVKQGEIFDVLAGVSAIDQEDGELTSSIVVDGNVDTSQIGVYVLTYSVIDSDANEVKQIRKVEVYSLKPEFKGIANAKIKVGDSFSALAGVSAHDAEDGDLTARIIVSGEVNSNKLGKYSLTYAVADSAGQTVTAERVITVVDDALVCDSAWVTDKVYLADDTVTHNGQQWQAGWWSQGDEPGTTGEWGVWRQIGDSDCGGDVTPSFNFTLTGLAAEYTIKSGQVSLSLTVNTNKAAQTKLAVTDTVGNPVNGGNYSAEINGNTEVNLSLANVTAGGYQLRLMATDSDNNTIEKQLSFNLKDAATPPTDGDYPPYVAGTQYGAGDIVLAADGNAYQCKPWPYTPWCGSDAYAPSTSVYWADAWNKI